MKEYLIGVGGVGGFYGGLLAESGADITLVSRGESFRAIKEGGLLLKRSEGVHLIYPQILENISEISEPELIILATKSYNLEEISHQLEKIVRPETTVITLQNGLDNDFQVAKHLNCEVIPGLVLVASTKTAANVITQRGTQKRLVFGPRDGKLTPKMREIEQIFKNAGIDAKLTEKIESKLWKKFLFVVSFSSATVAGRCPIGEALSNPDALRVYKKVLKEAIEVGEKEGVAFEPDIFETTLKGAMEFDPETKSSLLVDLENHRQTEVEALQGVIIRLAEKHGLAVPTTREIYRRICIDSGSLRRHSGQAGRE